MATKKVSQPRLKFTANFFRIGEMVGHWLFGKIIVDADV
jgi:hypothetical protein